MDLRELRSTEVQRHPWELARADFFCELLARRVLDHRIERVFDVGAGDAFLAGRLASLVGPRTEIVCIDPNYRPEQSERLGARLPAHVRLSRELPETRAGLILLLDVLEHIEDDRGELQHVVTHALEPDGFVLISVPAWPSLFTQHDVVLAHHRRYTPSQVRKLVGECGLRILDSGGAFHSLLPVRLLQSVWWASTQGRAEPGAAAGASAETQLARWQGGPALSRWLSRALRLDNSIARFAAEHGIELPGLSFWALCKREAA